MTYQQKQHQLFEDIEKKLKQGKTDMTMVEQRNNYINDLQIALTSVVFVPKNIQNKINELIDEFKQVDSRQYFFLPKSLHLTIQNIRTIASPPNFTEADVKKVIEVFQTVIPKYQKFSFELKGLFDLPTSLSIKGYCDEILKDLVLELREKLIKAGVPDNKKYASAEIFFGNINFCRYTTKPNKEFYKKIKELKNVIIGQMEVNTISLVTGNCVLHPDKTKIIKNYNLK